MHARHGTACRQAMCSRQGRAAGRAAQRRARTEGQRSSSGSPPPCASTRHPFGEAPAGRHCQRPKVTQEPSSRKEALPTSALVATPTAPNVAAAATRQAHRHCTASQRRAPRWPRRARGASDGTGSTKKPARAGTAGKPAGEVGRGAAGLPGGGLAEALPPAAAAVLALPTTRPAHPDALQPRSSTQEQEARRFAKGGVPPSHSPTPRPPSQHKHTAAHPSAAQR